MKICMAKFIYMCCDEMTNIDNTWILVHVYFVKKNKKNKNLGEFGANDKKLHNKYLDKHDQEFYECVWGTI